MKKTSIILSALFLLFITASPAFSLLTGEQAPDFTLSDQHGKPVKLSSYAKKFVVLEWLNRDCPFVKKHYDSGNMQGLQKEFTDKGVIWLSISSSAKGRQGFMTKEDAAHFLESKKSAATALLLDSDGKTGKLYDAKTTPHLYIVNPKGSLVYQGAIDDKASVHSADIQSSKNYVRTALEEALAGKSITTPSTASYGCSIKY